MNPITIERGDPLWEDSRVPRLCQVRSRQTCLWMIMILHIKIFFISKIRRTNWKVITTRQIEQILYGCRISQCCWGRTVFYDERHWRIFTIQRFSGLSWVHSAKRRRIIWTERLDQREHQNWARIGRYNLLPARWLRSGNQNYVCEQRQFSLMGHNFSWLKQIGHELEQQRAGNLRNAVRRICVEDEFTCFCKPIKRLKQNHKNEILLGHPQELYLLERGLGLLLNQENIRSPIIQCRRNWSIFFVMEAYLETMMERLNSGD